MTAGRHRDTGEQPQVVDIPGDLTPFSRWPRTPAPQPAPQPSEAEETGEFAVAQLRAAWDPPSIVLRPWDSTGPLPRIREPLPTAPPSMAWGWASCGALLAMFALTVCLITFGAA